MPPSQLMLHLMDPDSTSMTWWARVWERRPLNPVPVSIMHQFQVKTNRREQQKKTVPEQTKKFHDSSTLCWVIN